MNAGRLHQLQHDLEEEKNHLIDEISRLEQTGIGDTITGSMSELSLYDNHPADLGSETFERGKDIALRDNAHVLLEAVEHALHKIQDNTYGQCDECGSNISQDRLDALPWAALCIACQRQADKHKNPTDRPLEEASLAPPFHRTFLDTTAFDNVGYDGEDALQDALQYGSSDTPQDVPGSDGNLQAFPNSNEHPGIVDKADSIPVDYSTQPSRKPDKKTGR